jgi:hypothetical protein
MSCIDYEHPEDLDGTEGEWLAWRAVVCPRPGPDSTLAPYYRHKQEHVGQRIAERYWQQRRKSRKKYLERCAASGVTPEPHAPLTTYIPETFHGVCLDCPWVGEGWSSFGRAMNDAKAHQRAVLAEGNRHADD